MVANKPTIQSNTTSTPNASSSNYLIAAVGSTGDMHPFMSLAKALQSMGRNVQFMGPSFHADLLQKAGIPFIGLGTEADYLRIIATPDLWHPRRGFQALFGHYREPLIEAFHALMQLQHIEPLTVIGHPFALPAIAMAREKGLKARVVGTYLAPSNIRTVHDPLNVGPLQMPRWVPHGWRLGLWRLLDCHFVDPHAATALNEARAAVGLPPVRQSFLPYMQAIPELSLGLFPEWFAPPQPDWPRPWLTGDFQLFDASAHEPFSPALEHFLKAGPAPIVVTPGTANAHAADIFKWAAQALQELGLRAIFLTRHREQIPAQLPDDMLWQPYVALSRLLPHAGGMIHHGGIGTTAEALRAGVPQLVTPFAWDQFDNAGRVRSLGVAGWISASRASPRQLREAMAFVFRDAAVRQRSSEISSRFQQTSNPQALCHAIEAKLAVQTA